MSSSETDQSTCSHETQYSSFSEEDTRVGFWYDDTIDNSVDDRPAFFFPLDPRRKQLAAVDDLDVDPRINDRPSCLLRKRTNLRVHMKPNTPPFPKEDTRVGFWYDDTIDHSVDDRPVFFFSPRSTKEATCCR